MDATYLQTLVRRFPDLELGIKRLHRDDADFQSICEEMEMAEIACDRWKDLPDRADEYQKIFDRLQDEFLDYLSGKTREAFLRPLQQGMKDNGRNS
ncbi:hypothetical protein QO034_21040 [Sedimentitalea sp. JM2-8]|uniref:Uncharacterized protein n=1 Tax=Sedimentitalea xiamensis TaxID=3050037 RepID=A0ABT7FK84_9RHOB|nr:hypothetical protein [Sedimentitalea xiamensis]MDK3075557.1 hypothetical protein [Sedimentitalea xiamensis]